LRIILIGFGVVGQSLLKLIAARETELVNSYGFRPRIVAIADTKGSAVNSKGLDWDEMLSLKAGKHSVSSSTDFGRPGMHPLEAIESVQAEVVVEATPTNIRNGEPGLSHIKAAFRSRKHVVTTNKGPLALAMPALIELANYNKVCFRFSGTVGGGTPVLELAKNGLLGDRIISIRGILNGTTNYILSEMDEGRISFREALEQAQKLGYAEADPSMDIDGLDTACKLVIMTNWIMNRKVTLGDVEIEGIRKIGIESLEDAARKGRTIKLIGAVDSDLTVMPREIDRRDPLCVTGALNAVTLVSSSAGEETIIGRGAGGMETASAVLRDLLNINRNLANPNAFGGSGW